MAEEIQVSTQTEDDESLLDDSSRLSSILIGILIVVAGFLAYNFFQANQTTQPETTPESPSPVLTETEEQLKKQPSPQATKSEQQGQETTQQAPGGEAGTEETQQAADTQAYVVQAGDSLWEIAKKTLDNGFLYTEIAKANNLDPSAKLRIGTELQIPQIASAQDSGQEQAVRETELDETTPGDETATTDQTYVVQRGDTLWEIAENFYGDGSAWDKIFNYPENNLSMYTAKTTGETYPMVHAGNKLVIPAVPQETS